MSGKRHADPPRVLHIGNTANVAAELRDGLNSTGAAECLVVETQDNKLRFDEDIRLSWDWATSRLAHAGRHLSQLLLLKNLAGEADIVHIHHTGQVMTVLAKWAQMRGKPVVRHFHGHEVRHGKVSEEVRYADAVLVSTPDLLPYLSTSKPRPQPVWIPNPRQFPDSRPEPALSPPLRIVHAHLRNPVYADVFGTESLRAAVNRLAGQGYDVMLDEVSGLKHHDAIERYRACHIAVDKLRIGWYGVFGIECLSYGLPVLAGVSKDLSVLQPPVLPTTEETLEETLKELVTDQRLRERIGQDLFVRGRAQHDTRIVAARVSEIYRDLLG